MMVVATHRDKAAPEERVGSAGAAEYDRQGLALWNEVVTSPLATARIGAEVSCRQSDYARTRRTSAI
jgi:hypothetical protein